MRLIDADKFLKDNKEIIDCQIDHPKFQDTLRELIDSAETVDAVRMVRCKDCNYCTEITPLDALDEGYTDVLPQPFCRQFNIELPDKDFACIRSEKKG